jgi:MFS family permease
VLLPTALRLTSLLTGVTLLLLGSGLLGTLLAIRGGQEGYSSTALGLVMSAYFAGFLIGTHLAPRLVQRIGHIRAFSLFASAASVVAILHGLALDPWAWALGRVITGICLVGLYTVIESWLNAESPSALRGRVFALYMAINLLALAAGQFLILIADIGDLVLFAWVSILFSASLIPVTLTRFGPPPLVMAVRVRLRELLLVAPVGMAGAGVSGVMMGAFWGMGPLYAQQLGFDVPGVAVFMSLTVLAGAVLQWPLGLWSDRVDRRRVIALASAGAAVAAVLAAAFTAPGWPVLLAMAVFGGFSFPIYSLAVAHLNDFIAPEQMLEAAAGLLMIYGVGAMIGPTLVGTMMRVAGPAAFPALLALLGLALAGYAFWRLRIHRVSEHPQPFVAVVRTTPMALELTQTPEQKPPPDAG